MALNFPSTTGQATDGSFTHTESGVTWAWDGITWKSQAVQTQQSESDPVFLASPAGLITSQDVTEWDTSYGWGDHGTAGYLTSYTETDPVFTASAASSITSTQVSNWGTAYGWGDHGSAGYLTSYTETQTLDDVLSLGSTTTRDITTTGKIYYSNNFANSVDLPSASTYHGMFAHVHAEGHGYFAHAGAWTQLLDTGSSLSELANVSTTSPSTNDVLTWNGSSWTPSAAQGGGGGGTSLGSRQIFSGSTSNSHANNASENLTIAAYKGYALYKISVSEPAWVTLYVSTGTRTSDANRAITQDPAPGSGVLAEVITQSSSETVLFTPALIGYNDDSTPGTNIYLKVVNKSGSTQSINVELTVTQLEA